MHPLLHKNDPLLKQPCLNFDFDTGYSLANGDRIDARELFDILRTRMCENRGVGLAAPQIGIMTRAFVIGNPSDPENVISVFNPRIVDASAEFEMYEEGCLSFPDLYLKIKRPMHIRARFMNHVGVTDTVKFTGFTSRIFQHEYDHLDGLLYTKRATSYHLELAKNQLKSLNRLRKRTLTTREHANG